MTLRGFINLWDGWTIDDFELVDYETGAHYCNYLTEKGKEYWELGGDRVDATREILLSKEVMMLNRGGVDWAIEIYLD